MSQGPPVNPDPMQHAKKDQDRPAAMRWPRLWGALALVILSGVLLALALNAQRNQALQSGQRLTASFAQVIEEQTTRTMQTVDLRLQLAARGLADLNAAGQLNEASAREVLRDHGQSVPFVRAIWVMDAQGRILYDGDKGNIGISLQDRTYFQNYLSEPSTDFHLGTPVRSRTTGTWLLPASRPLHKPNGSFDGIIVAAVEPPYFDSLWRTLDLGHGGSVAMATQAGVLMMRAPHVDEAMGKSFKDTPIFKDMLPHSPNGDYVDASPVDGIDRLYSYRTLKEQPGFVVVVGQSKDAVLAAWRTLATVATLIWLLASITVIALSILLDRTWRQREHARQLTEQSARRLALGTEAAAIGIWDWDLKSDHWTATATYFTLLGDTLDSHLPGFDVWLERIHPNDRAQVEATLKAVIAGGVNEFHYEARFRHANGHHRWMDVTGRALEHDDQGRATRMLGARTDITERKEALQTRLQLLERVTDAFVAMDRDWVYTFINAKAKTLLGKENQILIGKTMWEVCPELIGLPLHQACVKAMADQQPAHVEAYYAPDQRWFENHVYPSPEGVTLYFQDITPRKRAEQAVQDSEARYRQLFDSNPQPMWVFDTATLAFLVVNDAAIAHYGYSREEFLGMTIKDIRPPEDHEKLAADVHSAQDNYSSAALWRHQRKDGSLIQVDITAHSLNYADRAARLVLAHDVTAREQALTALRLSEDNLSITLQSIGDAVIATDQHGNITRMNPTAERLTAWPQADALGQPLTSVFRIINAQTRLPAVDPAQLVMRSGKVVGLANHTALLARDGREYQIFDSAAPMRSPSGEIIGVVLVFSDVTEAYRIRESLEATTAMLERTSEIAKVGAWEMDLANRTATVSREGMRLHDLDPAQPVPNMAETISWYHPDAQEEIRAAMKAAIAHGTPFDFELPMVTVHGRPQWLHTKGIAVMEDGKPVKIRGVVQDVTERHLAEAALSAAAQHTQTILDNLMDGVITICSRGQVESINKAACALFGYAPEEVLGHNISMLTPEPHRSQHDGYLQRYVSTGKAHILGKLIEVEGQRKDGALFPMSLQISKVVDEGVTTFIGIVRDITQHRQDIEEIRRLAFYDSLTGLPNRRLLMDRLRQAMHNSKRSGHHGALMFLDLDHFKQLNDTQGHDVGDLLLQQVASRIHGCARVGDSLARLGGDEFVVLLESLSPNGVEAANQAEIVANKILHSFQSAFHLNGHDHESTTSIGIVVFKGEQDAMDELLKKADLAMYQAKAAGRNNARFFDPAMQAAVAARDAMEKDMRDALATRAFALHYQIQVNEAGVATGAEALVRWNHPTQGMVSPAHFIPLAEETGLIQPLGQWVLETACAQLVTWANADETAHWTVSVNVSALQFALPDYVQTVTTALQKTGANPRLLKLELTESMLASDVDDVVAKMRDLKSQGVSLSLDDFGTGYSSLAYLKRLPLDQIKIDQSFVRNVLSDASDAAIARTILALGRSLGLQVIAEGVETLEQRNFLAGIGCHAYQGYYFGRPVAADQLLKNTSKNDC